jgi:hypothetical protein
MDVSNGSAWPTPTISAAPVWTQDTSSEPTRRSKLGIASLVSSLVNLIPPLFWILPVPAILAIVFGFVSQSKMKRDPLLGGRGFAMAGIIVGFVNLAWTVFVYWVLSHGFGGGGAPVG